MVETAWITFDSLDDSVRLLLDILWPAHERIVDFCLKSGATAAFLTGVRIHGARPDYSLAHKSISRMADLRAGYSLDIYDYREGQAIVQ
jgi:hypothetical protein